MNPREHAERGVLGAILLDPRHLADLSEWLAPEDFHSPQHADLYRAMLILDERGATPNLADADPEQRATAITEYAISLGAHVSQAGTRGIDAPYLHTLMQSCPRAEHAPYYARMVVEADTHRVIIENATRLAQLAHGDGDPDNLFLHTAAFREVVNDLAARWGIDPNDPSPDAASRIGSGQTSFVDQFAPELDAPPSAEERTAAAEREDILLACIMRSPDQLDELRDYLTPDDFAAPGRGDIYKAALTIHDQATPIDPITLTWQARQSGSLATDPPDDAQPNEPRHLTGEDLIRLYGDGLPADVAPYYAKQIIEHSITTTISQVARDLKTLASDPRLGVADLLPMAIHRIDNITAQQDRLRSAEPQQHPEATNFGL